VYRPEHAAALLAVFRKVLSPDFTPLRRARTTLSAAEYASIANRLECFFSTECGTPSFCDMILAYNMVAFRRYLTWPSLMRTELPDFIPTRFYDCTSDVFRLIVAHVRALDRDIASLHKEKASLEWIKAKAVTDGSPAPEPLTGFYAGLGKSWHSDSRDSFLLLLTFLDGTVSRLRELTQDTWQVMTASEKLVSMKILSNVELDAECAAIVSHVEAAGARYRLASPPEIPLVKYVSAPSAASLFISESQSFIHTKLSTALTSLMRCALLINGILAGRSGGYPPEFYLSHMVDSPRRWRGSSLFDVLDSCAGLFLQACAFFRVSALEREIARIDAIVRKLNTLEKEKENLDSSGVLRRLMDQGAG
jgi:hypothetical protein